MLYIFVLLLHVLQRSPLECSFHINVVVVVACIQIYIYIFIPIYTFVCTCSNAHTHTEMVCVYLRFVFPAYYMLCCSGCTMYTRYTVHTQQGLGLLRLGTSIWNDETESLLHVWPDRRCRCGRVIDFAVLRSDHNMACVVYYFVLLYILYIE